MLKNNRIMFLKNMLKGTPEVKNRFFEDCSNMKQYILGKHSQKILE